MVFAVQQEMFGPKIQSHPRPLSALNDWRLYISVMRKCLMMLAATGVLLSCNKYPGEGGNASIEGTVVEELRLTPTNPATTIDVYPGADKEVFIVYGDHVSPDDRIWTSYDGRFRFRNLRKGKYTIYVYSTDTIGIDGTDPDRMPMVREVEVSKRNATIDLGEIRIVKEQS